MRGGLKELFKMRNITTVLVTLMLASALFFSGSYASASVGSALYREHCSGCHSSIQDSGMKTISQYDIARAIQKVRKMKHLKFLSDRAMVAIADALKSKLEVN